MSNNSQWNLFQSNMLNGSDSSMFNFKTLSTLTNLNNYPSSRSSNHSPPNYNSQSSQNFPMPSQYQSSQFHQKDSSMNNMFNNGLQSSNFDVFSSDNTAPVSRYPPAGNDIFGGHDTATASSSNNSNFSNESFGNNQGVRETGIIEKLLHSYGFIQCCERQARLFFHFSQFSGNIEHLKIGDPVEFEMTYDRRTGKPIASTVTKIAPEVVLSEERVTGVVTTELRTEGSGGDTQGRISYENRGECFFLPYNKDDVEGNVTLRTGDQVSFQIATNQRGNLGATHVRLENPVHPVKYQGVVCSMKDVFGYIERADIVKEISFPFTEFKDSSKPLQLGDDVEFIIQTRSGKEVACNIERLPPGSVIFEDIEDTVMKGQVLKPLDKTPQSHLPSEPLPGRIRYRAPDYSEVEVSFGEKDQQGDFTLRHGDWVEFRIATDRRDQLKRATNISLLPESFVVSGERRELGIIAVLKQGFGFLRSVEREPKIYFTFNEVLDVQRKLECNDEVEFTVAQDPSSSFGNSRQSAIRIKHLPRGSVQFEVLIEEGLVGIVTVVATEIFEPSSPSKNNAHQLDEVTYEPGVITLHSNGVKRTILYNVKDCNGKYVPRQGDKVRFNLYQIKRNKELIAMNIHLASTVSNNNTRTSTDEQNRADIKYGYIAALKDGFGFIETIALDSEVFFRYANLNEPSASLELGMEVEYTLSTRNTGNGGSCASAENVRILPPGSISDNCELLQPNVILDGVVSRPLRSVNPEQTEYAGIIQEVPTTEEENISQYEFGIKGLINKRELLQVGDPVQFQIDSKNRAVNIIAIRKKQRAHVDAIKGLFGFLTHEVEGGKKLFFHTSEVTDGIKLNQGDLVEFVLVVNQRSGKSSGCNVTKISSAENSPPKQPSQRPEHLINRIRTISVIDDGSPKLVVIRQPLGPDGSKGFDPNARKQHNPGQLIEV